ncbi:DUF6314 family protein [Oceaniglobus ichthyenteri]|uniref:DUF6314 family protein n=1 Tax=Oceaniglobus ichthyenteri TaxID=2136177 RepID=UPI001F0B8615|nr:DUF6314 family protein [Oceaniglobus ichthyenteri]
MQQALIGLADFIGLWRIERDIEDRRAGNTARFKGQVRFEPGDSGLIYDETGQLYMPGQGAITATRRYFWRQQEGEIAVSFEDGRAFHRFDPGAVQPTATHVCPPDTYRLSYDFAAWPVWYLRHDVTGPRKSYSMRSCYAPCAGAETSAKSV